MHAILLATSEAKKLHPLSETIPTPMLPIANQPVLALSVEILARHGIKDLLVNLHHLSGSVESYFGVGRRWGVRMEYLLQRDPLGTAGAVRWAKAELENKGTFLVVPGDSIIDFEIDAAVAQHQASNNLITVIAHPDAKNDCAVAVSSESTLTFDQTDTKAYATGAYICEPELIAHIPNRQQFDIFEDLLPKLVQSGNRVGVHIMQGYWNPLHSFHEYSQAQKIMLQSAAQQVNGLGEIRYSTISGNRMGTSIWVGKNNAIHPSARIVPPVCIGDNCQIGKDVEIGPYTIIGSNVIIDDEASISHSTIIDHTYVGQLVNVKNRVVNKTLMVDTDTSESMEIVDRFLIGEAAPSVVDIGLRRVMDGLLASFFLLLISPLFLLISLFTLITSGGILRRDSRIGTSPKALISGQSIGPFPLQLYQFRTERNGQATLIGRFLAKWELHRLPELFNIINGDIGFVGVKPLTQQEAVMITEVWQRKRFDYMAGFTGLWYTTCSTNSTLDETLIADVFYTATRTRAEDKRIMRSTIGRWWQRARGVV